MFKRIDHVEIIPRDLEKAIKFYTEVLGFKVKERKKIGMPPLEEIAYVQLGDTVIELMSVQNPSPLAPDLWRVGYRMIAIEVEDMDRAVEYLKSKGVEISSGPIVLGKSKRAEMKDPDGLSIELRQW
jgi:glyoxylase I family protein